MKKKDDTVIPKNNTANPESAKDVTGGIRHGISRLLIFLGLKEEHLVSEEIDPQRERLQGISAEVNTRVGARSVEDNIRDGFSLPKLKKRLD